MQSNFRIRIHSGKILLLRLELMLNTDTTCLGEVFILKSMPKLDHLGVLFEELRVEDSRCFDVVSRLFLITPHSHIGVDGIYRFHIVAQKYQNRFLASYA